MKSDDNLYDFNQSHCDISKSSLKLYAIHWVNLNLLDLYKICNSLCRSIT